jgi:hypothetical protein
MEFTIEVKDSKADFVKELFSYFDFVELIAIKDNFTKKSKKKKSSAKNKNSSK